MIIFTPLYYIKELLMQARPDSYNFYEFNLSSPMNIGVPLAELVPEFQLITDGNIREMLDTPEFDVLYGNFIMNNQIQFFRFMNIMLSLYSDPCACVIIYVQPSPIRDIIMESLMKLIQQRYGYSSYIINDQEDVLCIQDNTSFSPRGIVMMQADSERAVQEGYYGPITVPEE